MIRNNFKIDSLDYEIIRLLVTNRKYSSREIADILGKPLSTTQRRVRLLLERGLVNYEYGIEFDRLGLRVGSLHMVYENGDLEAGARQIQQIPGVLSVCGYIGHLDLSARFVYRNSKDILEFMSAVKSIPSIKKSEWSEEVISLPGLNPIMGNGKG